MEFIEIVFLTDLPFMFIPTILFIDCIKRIEGGKAIRIWIVLAQIVVVFFVSFFIISYCPWWRQIQSSFWSLCLPSLIGECITFLLLAVWQILTRTKKTVR